jgi:hypothetical protein
MADIQPIAGHPAWDSIPEGQTDRPRAQDIGHVDFSDYVNSFVPPNYLVDRLIITGRVYSLTAKTGHFKTALATLMGMCVACGSDFAGKETMRGKVLYLSGENDEDQKSRVIATSQEFGLLPEPGQFHVIPYAEAMGVMVGKVDTLNEKYGPYSLVIIDTSAAYFHGEDENSNTQAHAHASYVREISKLPGSPSVLLLCHPPKAASQDGLLPRGGGALLNAVDGNLTLWRSGERVSLHHLGKFRGPSFDPLEFQMKLVPLDGKFDGKGRAIDSVVVTPISDAEKVKIDIIEIKDENKVLYELLHHPDSSLADIAKSQGWIYNKSGEPDKSRVSRLLHGLAEDQLVLRGRRKWELTAKGKKEAAEIT